MINNVRLINFKAHQDTSVGLGRFTALVGDNASGKTSVLEALELLGVSDGGAMLGYGLANLVRRGCERSRVHARGQQQGQYTSDELEVVIEAAGSNVKFVTTRSGSRGEDRYSATANGVGHLSGGSTGEWNKVSLSFGAARLYRLNADDVANESPIQDPGVEIDGVGTNTGAVLTSLKLTDDARFERIEEALRRLVPTVERIRLKQERINAQVLNRILFDFRGAANVPAHGASQGTLVLLALLTVLHGPGRPNLLLLDDLEHTLHPRAQMELVRLIKSLLALGEFADVQVVATTHSPYVLDELDVEDVRAFAIGDDGCVRSKSLSSHPEAASSKGTLTAGQLWSLDPERTWVLKE